MRFDMRVYESDTTTFIDPIDGVAKDVRGLSCAGLADDVFMSIHSEGPIRPEARSESNFSAKKFREKISKRFAKKSQNKNEKSAELSRRIGNRAGRAKSFLMNCTANAEHRSSEHCPRCLSGVSHDLLNFSEQFKR